MKYLIAIGCIMFSISGNAQVLPQPAEKIIPHLFHPTNWIVIECPGLANWPRVYKEPKFKFGPIPNTLSLASTALNTMPIYSIRDIVSLSPNAYQKQRGGDVNIRGGRSNEVLYIIDGMQIPRN